MPYRPLAHPFEVRYRKVYRDAGYPWAQKVITFTHRGVVLNELGYIGHNDGGEQWVAQDGEIDSLFESLPMNPYLAESETRKDIRMARLRANALREAT